MEDAEQRLEPHIQDSTWPDWVLPGIAKLGVNGLQIKDHGGPGLTSVESGAILYEMAKIDGSIGLLFFIQNFVGIASIDQLGDSAQRDRMLPSLINLDKVASFALTEPENGSDASNLKTTARKVDGGFILNGTKRWIGNGTFADYIIVWARYESKVQGFVVTKGSKGLRTEKMEGKIAVRVAQNAMIYMNDVFVPDDMRLVKGTDFETSANSLLRTSRL